MIMKITRIILKSGNKYTAFIDDKKVDLYDDVILKYHLLNIKEVDDNLFNEIMCFNDEIKYYYKMINFISYKERTQTEIEKKLYTFHLSKVVINSIIERLKNEGYLDKNRYLKAFIHDKVNLTEYGPLKIKFELIKLKYSEDEINDEIEKYSDDIWINKINKIVNKKIKANHNKSKKNLVLNIKQDLVILGYYEYMYQDILNNIDFDDSDIRSKEYHKLMKKYEGKYSNEKLDYIVQSKLREKGF